MNIAYDVVIPTIGRPSLGVLLHSLARAAGPPPNRVFVVDDRRVRSGPLPIEGLGAFGERVHLQRGPAAGPAAARNRGWRRSQAPWIAFLDDDVIVEDAWCANLERDLAACGNSSAGSQGRVHVPMPPDRAPTDWERNVRGLQGARFITADCAFRRTALREVDGFDERFPRAYREDAELALRLTERGYAIDEGRRCVEHPVRPADAWISVRLQAGNADDALMRALHGAQWHARANAAPGRLPWHVATVAGAAGALACASLWAGLTAHFAWQRIAPGPRDLGELAKMLTTSAAIPFAAVYHRWRGEAGLARTLRRTHRLPAAVLFDRDGTLIVDDPQLRGPEDLRLVPGAREQLARLRDAGIEVGVVTNQPRVGEGSLSRAQLAAIHAGLDALAGPFATIQACPHAAGDGCGCRKPAPGMILAAAAEIGVEPRDCVVVGDIGSDVDAAMRAGARAVLVPTPATRREEIEAAPAVARDLRAAVDAILGGAA